MSKAFSIRLGKVRNKFLQLPVHPVPKLTALAILSHVNRETGKAWPSASTIAKEIGYGVATVKRGIKALKLSGCFITESLGSQKAHYLYSIKTVASKHRVCIYEPNLPSKGWSDASIINEAYTSLNEKDGRKRTKSNRTVSPVMPPNGITGDTGTFSGLTDSSPPPLNHGSPISNELEETIPEKVAIPEYEAVMGEAQLPLNIPVMSRQAHQTAAPIQELEVQDSNSTSAASAEPTASSVESRNKSGKSATHSPLIPEPSCESDYVASQSLPGMGYTVNSSSQSLTTSLEYKQYKLQSEINDFKRRFQQIARKVANDANN